SPAARIRMTTSSTPPVVGMVATRSSMSSGPNFLNLILPSWGLRFSEISRSHMIFRRVTRGLRYDGGISMYGPSEPSLRNRMPHLPLPGGGSTWMADAPWLYASMMILFTSFTSSLSAAAETSSAPPSPTTPESSSSRLESISPIDSPPPADSA